jgi:predicted metalloprotease
VVLRLSGATGGSYDPPMLVNQRRAAAVLSVLALVFLLGAPAGAGAAPTPIAPFLDSVLTSVDTYWHQTDAAAGRPAPSVQHVWVVPGGQANTACGVSAGDNAAFYCPNDDTIYIGQAFATALYDGVAGTLPGQAAGFGRAVGALAVSYVVAHEYGHNVQQERGVLAGRRRVLPTELNADCLAGTWVRWDYGQGKVSSADVQQVVDAALAVGDFDFLSPQHHGTPQERRDALLTGLRAADPSACDMYLQR